MQNLPQNHITTEDLEFLFSGQKRKRKRKSITVLKYTALFLIISIFTFTLINYQALYKEISFWYQNNYKNESDPQNTSFTTAPDRRNVYQAETSDIPIFSDNHIFIPFISVNAPIVWLVENTPEVTNVALQNGVIHLLGSSMPGTNGNVFITGHSSNYVWAPGKYKSVFALLDKLSVGDVVYIKYQDTVYIYKIFEQKTIKPSDTSVLEQSNKSILTLMTCTPVGTSLNRLIIKANQIVPDPRFNSGFGSEQPTGSLPEIR